MSRREIRRMLLERRSRPAHQHPVHRVRPWAVGLLMAVVLAAGIGIGVMLGHGMVEPEAGTAPAEAVPPLPTTPRPAALAGGLAPSLRPPPAVGVAEPAAAPAFAPPLAIAETPESPPEASPAAPATSPIDQPDPEAADLPPPPSRQQAMSALLAPSAPVPSVASGGRPAWLRYAVAPLKPVAGRPMIAIVIDDMGVDHRRSEKVVGLKGPLTLSWMTYAENLHAMTELAHRRGHELMVHVPMQPLSRSYDPGPDVLEVDLSAEEIRRRLRWGLSRFDGFVGINNHMGSRFTANAAGMGVVMEELKARGLLFLDSLTTQNSVGGELARRYGVPLATRQVFLDNEMKVPAVAAQLAHTEALARKFGAAIAIGHPHDATIEALTAWLPTLEAKGFALVPVSTIVQAGSHH